MTPTDRKRQKKRKEKKRREKKRREKKKGEMIYMKIVRIVKTPVCHVLRIMWYVFEYALYTISMQS